ncbi:putative mitochondrial aaa atpase [Golovinomyces cichoracearum]|uniref:Putative mitochondrial aaa atpase n=1 Tax=Golovinomyces cichoracearum TaxID=62708 RepID=A0A420HM19_9PEZI|nr:putative mitochondrial aaa atpase [Golovinomyces cichoracearum]
MYASVNGAFRTASRSRPLSIYKLRGVQASRIRNFYLSTSHCKSENPSCEPDTKPSEIPADDVVGEEGKSNKHDEPSSKPDHNSLSRRMKNGIGSRLKKTRSNPASGLPPISLPNWFVQNNVHYGGNPKPVKLVGQLHIAELVTQEENPETQESSLQVAAEEINYSTPITYSLNHHLYTEILATLRAGLSLRPPKNTDTKITLRPITVLQCHKDGASTYLDHIVSRVSSDLGADLIQIDAQDIAQIIGSYLDENLAWNSVKTSMYGYSAQRVSGKLEDYDDYKRGDQEMEQNIQFADESPPASVLGSIGVSSSYAAEDFSKSFSVFVQKPHDNSRSTSWSHDENNPSSRSMDPVSNDRSKESSTENSWNDLKVSAMLKAIVEASDYKRMKEGKETSHEINSFQNSAEINELSSSEDVEENISKIRLKPLIIQVKDYQELRSLDGGIELLQKLQKVINKKWLDGRDIICVGTSEGVETVYDKKGIQILQEDITGAEKRTIFVPPDRQKSQHVKFMADRKMRIRRINIRHLEDIILKLSEGSESLPIVNLEQNLDSTIAFTTGLEEKVWTFPRVHRIGITLLGLPRLNKLATNPKTIDGADLGQALKILSNSDDVKFAWGVEEIKESGILANQNPDAKKTSRLTYNAYEKKLLSGVVSPEKIRTTFADIRASEEMIEALKTLTSLSLTRPEAFTYGILRRDKIPGILLYGPPGTGKTLLAKAVAKESGATVLEVTAADLNNMYVGEGEKNVKALFTLAKKLSPCVIFIDEADSMFGSREGSRQRSSHREMINQFLREWDGISDFSGFIMVATNRPYDLDDAILRRIPRRLLVDLPLEKDREEILKIHLKDELLDDSVSLSALAKNTPYYSGSDLKNVCVAAALACIRDENNMAALHTGDKPYEYPKKRVLQKKHFDKAIEEISASINEDMSSLKEIKKFDEKYGDRKGRRKKGPGLGFGVAQILEKDSDGARVRPLVDV